MDVTLFYIKCQNLRQFFVYNQLLPCILWVVSKKNTFEIIHSLLQNIFKKCSQINLELYDWKSGKSLDTFLKFKLSVEEALQQSSWCWIRAQCRGDFNGGDAEVDRCVSILK